MALRGKSGKQDVKKSSYYVWYLGAREAKGVDAMPSAIDYLLERERLQEPFKVTLQVSSKGLKIIQTVHPGGSTRSAVKQLVPGHALLAAVQREDVVAASLLLPNPATNNPVHVHAYRCDSVETAELLGGQLKLLASHSDSLQAAARIAGSLDVTTSQTRLLRNGLNLGSDGRSTRESESSEGSGDHHHHHHHHHPPSHHHQQQQPLRHLQPVQSTSIYESLAAELRAKLGRGNSDNNDAGPLLLPPRDYDTVHRHRGNLTGIELRRCLNQTIVGQNGLATTTATTTTGINGNANNNTATANGNNVVVSAGGAGTRSAASSGIGSDSAATPPPYHHPLHTHQHPLGPRPTRPTRDSSSDDDWGAGLEEVDYLVDREATSVSLPRLPRSPERSAALGCPLIKSPIRASTSPVNNNSSSSSSNNNINNNNNNNSNNRMQRKSAEHRQRSPSPQYQPRLAPGDSPTSPRDRFHDAKEMFRQMEREAIVVSRPAKHNNGRAAVDSRPLVSHHRSEPVSRQSSQSLLHEEPALQAQHVQRPSRQQQFASNGGHHHQAPTSQQQLHERLIRRGAMPHHHQVPSASSLDIDEIEEYRSRARARQSQYQSSVDRPIQAQETDRPRPRSFYEVPMAARELRGPRNPMDSREVREYTRGQATAGFLREKPQLQMQQRPRPFTYGELADTDRYPGLDRENARPAVEIDANFSPARYRHSYAEPPRLGLAALHPY